MFNVHDIGFEKEGVAVQRLIILSLIKVSKLFFIWLTPFMVVAIIQSLIEKS